MSKHKSVKRRYAPPTPKVTVANAVAAAMPSNRVNEASSTVQKAPTQKIPDPQLPTPPKHLPITLSALALIVSAVSLVLSYKAFNLNEASGLPMLTLSMDLAEPIVADHPVVVRAKLENYGKTAAKDLLGQTRLYFLPPGDLPKVDFDSLGKFATVAKDQKLGDVIPGKAINWTAKEVITFPTNNDVDSVLTGRTPIFVYGRVRYWDFAGKKHTFLYCRSYKNQLGSAEPLKLAVCDDTPDIYQ